FHGELEGVRMAAMVLEGIDDGVAVLTIAKQPALTGSLPGLSFFQAQKIVTFSQGRIEGFVVSHKFLQCSGNRGQVQVLKTCTCPRFYGVVTPPRRASEGARSPAPQIRAHAESRRCAGPCPVPGRGPLFVHPRS